MDGSAAAAAMDGATGSACDCCSVCLSSIQDAQTTTIDNDDNLNLNTFAAAAVVEPQDACTPDDNGNQPKPWNIIRIGFLNAVTGQLSQVARDFGVAIDLAIARIRSDGILLPKHEIVLATRDTRLSQAEGIAEALDLAANFGADAVLGAIASSVSKASQLVLLNFGIPQLSFSSTAPELSNQADFPFFVRNVPSDALQGAVMVQLVHSLGWTQFAIIATDDIYGRAGADQVVTTANQFGMSVLARQDYSTGSGVRPTRQIQILKDSGARIFLYFGLVEDALLIFAEAMQQGLFGPEYAWVVCEGVLPMRPDADYCSNLAASDVATICQPCYSSSLNCDAQVNLTGSGAMPSVSCSQIDLECKFKRRLGQESDIVALYNAMRGLIGFRPRQGDGPLYDEFLETWRNLSITNSSLGIGATPGDYSSFAYDAVFMYARVFDAIIRNRQIVTPNATVVGSVDGALILDMLRQTHFEGVTGLISFDANGDRIAVYEFFNWVATNNSHAFVLRGLITPLPYDLLDTNNFGIEFVAPNGSMSADNPSTLTFYDDLSVLPRDYACSSMCQSATQCSGPGPDACSSCAQMVFNGTCVRECPNFTFLREYTAQPPPLPPGGRFSSVTSSLTGSTPTPSPVSTIVLECVLCDPNCDHGCFGAGPSKCSRCRDLSYGGACVAACPVGTIISSTRSCTTVYDYNTQLRIAFQTIAALLIAMCLLTFYLVYAFRDMKVVLSGNPLFLRIILVGAVIELASVFVVAAEHVSDELCSARVWTQHLGFAIMFTALFCKTYQVARVYRVKVDRRATVTTRALFKIFAQFLAFFVGYLIVFTIVDPSRPESYLIRGDTIQYNGCSRNWWLYSLLLFELLFMGIGVFLAWTVRKAPSAWNESRHVVLSVYNFMFVTVVIEVLLIAASLEPDVQFVLQSLQIFFTVPVVVVLIFGPKLRMVYRGKGNVVLSQAQENNLLNVMKRQRQQRLRQRTLQRLQEELLLEQQHQQHVHQQHLAQQLAAQQQSGEDENIHYVTMIENSDMQTASLNVPHFVSSKQESSHNSNGQVSAVQQDDSDPARASLDGPPPSGGRAGKIRRNSSSVSRLSIAGASHVPFTLAASQSSLAQLQAIVARVAAQEDLNDDDDDDTDDEILGAEGQGVGMNRLASQRLQIRALDSSDADGMLSEDQLPIDAILNALRDKEREQQEIQLQARAQAQEGKQRTAYRRSNSQSNVPILQPATKPPTRLTARRTLAATATATATAAAVLARCLSTPVGSAFWQECQQSICQSAPTDKLAY
ncbi:hypothetical protein CAOG_007551 [Capsaspora owczarzaki ATCC 30864]|uniref:G-protein coupled receptors family 3 profile domain-containing protein n=1 Tax=Capsaspora owczarzaki (strain ATCC 30864) TaxID=595528 RepID=A0A0D2WW06_CAPO3|nr:hypothetical protein CAOG_007551 [Capsaspora owczarzaki ATCC 30864]